MLGPFAIPLGLLSMGFWALTRDEGKPLFGEKSLSVATLRTNVEFKAAGQHVIQAFKPQARATLLQRLGQSGLAAVPIDGQRGVVLYQLTAPEAGAPSAAQIASLAQSKGLAVLGSLTLADPHAPQYLLFATPAQYAQLIGQTSAFAQLLAPGVVVKHASPPAPATPPAPALDVPPELQADITAALADDAADTAGLLRMAAVVKEAGHAPAAALLEKRAAALDLRRKMQAARDGEAPKKPARKEKSNGVHVEAVPPETALEVVSEKQS